MDFDRVNRLRESAKRQRELRQRDERIKRQMASAEGSKKIQRWVVGNCFYLPNVFIVDEILSLALEL